LSGRSACNNPPLSTNDRKGQPVRSERGRLSCAAKLPESSHDVDREKGSGPLRLGAFCRYLVSREHHRTGKKSPLLVQDCWIGSPRTHRDLPWRRTRDPYAIWFRRSCCNRPGLRRRFTDWERWMSALQLFKALGLGQAGGNSQLWEGLAITRGSGICRKPPADCGRARREFPQDYEAILALPGSGRYTAGAIASIAFNQPTAMLDGNVIRVLTRLYGIAENPREKATNERLWCLSGELVTAAFNLATPTAN